jgi:large subunit ribosomal protein L21
VLEVSTLDAELGSQVELRDVLLISDGDKVSVGNPNIADAVVVAEVLEHGKGAKVISFKYKAKVRYRRKRGHRQPFTRLAVQEVRLGGAPPARPSRRVKPETEETPAEAAEAPSRTRRGQAQFAGRSPEAPAPRRRRSGKADEGKAQE